MIPLQLPDSIQFLVHGTEHIEGQADPSQGTYSDTFLVLWIPFLIGIDSCIFSLGCQCSKTNILVSPLHTWPGNALVLSYAFSNFPLVLFLRSWCPLCNGNTHVPWFLGTWHWNFYLNLFVCSYVWSLDLPDQHNFAVMLILCSPSLRVVRIHSPKQLWYSFKHFIYRLLVLSSVCFINHPFHAEGWIRMILLGMGAALIAVFSYLVSPFPCQAYEHVYLLPLGRYKSPQHVTRK